MDVISFFKSSTQQDLELRVVGTHDSPLFVAKDVGVMLGLIHIKTSIANFSDNERKTCLINTLHGPREMTVLTEAGLYRLIYTGRTEYSESFRDFVHDILKELRTKGRVEAKDFLQVRKQHSRTLVQTYSNQACFYLMKVMDVPSSKKRVFKLGYTSSDLNERYRYHQRVYREFPTDEGEVTCVFVLPHVCPRVLEQAVMLRLFPKHRYEWKGHQELVMTDEESFSYDSLIKVIKEEAEKKTNHLVVISELQNELQVLRKEHEDLKKLLQSFCNGANAIDAESKLNETSETTQVQSKLTVSQSEDTTDSNSADANSNTLNTANGNFDAVPSRTSGLTKGKRKLAVQKIDPQTKECVKVYFTFKAAAKDTGTCSDRAIINACKKPHVVGGFRWKRIDPNQPDLYQVVDLEPTQETTKAPIDKVVQMNSDRTRVLAVFKNQTECADVLGVCKATVSHRCANGATTGDFVLRSWSDVSLDLIEEYEVANGGYIFESEEDVIVRHYIATGSERCYVGAYTVIATLVGISPDKLRECLQDEKTEHVECLWREERRIVRFHSNGSYSVLPNDGRNDLNYSS